MGRSQPYTAQREEHSRNREQPVQRLRGRNKPDLFQKEKGQCSCKMVNEEKRDMG